MPGPQFQFIIGTPGAIPGLSYTPVDRDGLFTFEQIISVDPGTVIEIGTYIFAQASAGLYNPSAFGLDGGIGNASVSAMDGLRHGITLLTEGASLTSDSGHNYVFVPHQTAPVNAPPIATADSVVRTNTQQRFKIPVSSLLANDSDPENAALTITSVSNAQPAGATVILLGGFAIYTAPSTTAGNGGFSYTLSDGTLSSVGSVTVIETAPEADTTLANVARITRQGGNIALTFIGVPGRSYRVQYSTSSGPPFTWIDYLPSATHTAGSDTFFQHTDPAASDSQRFYRAIATP